MNNLLRRISQVKGRISPTLLDESNDERTTTISSNSEKEKIKRISLFSPISEIGEGEEQQQPPFLLSELDEHILNASNVRLDEESSFNLGTTNFLLCLGSSKTIKNEIPPKGAVEGSSDISYGEAFRKISVSGTNSDGSKAEDVDSSISAKSAFFIYFLILSETLCDLRVPLWNNR